MRVSALIPTYNRLSHLPHAIDSILAQTLPVDEIVVLDDGSTDDTASAIRERYGARVRVVRQANAGVARARQRAIEEAHGEWVAFLDSDDLWRPTKLERQFQALTALGDNFGVCFTNCAYTGNPGLHLSPFDEAGLDGTAPFGPLQDTVKFVLGKFTPIYIQSLLARRALLFEAGGFDEALKVAEDTDILFRLTFKTSFCFVAEQLVEIDRTPSRSDGLMDSFQKMDDRTYVCMQHMLSKWLALPELTDPGTRAQIREHLRLLNYGWAVGRFSQMQLKRALQNIHDLRALGDDYGTIFGTFAARAAGKLNRKLRRG